MSLSYLSRRSMVIGSILISLSIATSYLLTLRRLSEARIARREDDCRRAEILLASCWRLPALSRRIEFEEELLGVQQGDLRNEKEWLSRVKEDTFDRVLILEALAKGNLTCFQWVEAQDYADSILKQDPKEARAYWLRGLARIEMQRVELARQDLEEAARLAPNSFAIGCSLADWLYQQGYVKAALEKYQSLYHQQQDSVRILLAMSRCWQDLSQYGPAREIAEALLEIDPNSLEGLVERSRIALREGSPEEAERWIRQAIERSPDNADANFVLRLTLQAQKRVDAELDQRIERNDRRQAELKTILNKRSNDPSVLTDVGRWMMKTGHDDEVLGWFYTALKIDSDHVAAHEGLAEFFQRSDQIQRAAFHARQASLVGGQHGKSHSVRPVAQKQTRRPAIALRSPEDSTNAEASTAEVQRLCSACHAYPEPDSMPRSVWRKEVKQGYDFLRDSNLSGDYPSLEKVVHYYEGLAAERLPPLQQAIATSKPLLQFEKRGTGFMPRLPPSPGITHANLGKLGASKQLDLILCETRQDALMLLKPYQAGPGGIIIPQVPSPCHTTVCDLNLDGIQDILVASIGSFFPTDDRLGKVLWLQGKASGEFDATELLNGVGRVTDIQVADFNKDGKSDLVVAIFGWRESGEILYLENQTVEWSQPKFAQHVVDPRHGAIHVPVADLNGDGLPDFVSIISQEHEKVVAYLNRGDGSFDPSEIFAAPHPTFGCTGIELVDLDSDGDLDVLLTNGDILDPPYLLKPYHGVHWLENKGAYPFQHHALASMYGASRAIAADFDRDGDQDVVAVSFLPELLFPDRDRMRIPAVVLLEQLVNKEFSFHVLETGTCDHYSCVAGDWDDDGRVDFAVTQFAWNGSKPMNDAAILWKNTTSK